MLQPEHTLIIAMPNGFDLKRSTAAQTTRLGYYHGFSRIGVPGQLVQYDHLLSASRTAQGPIFWLTYDDYRSLDEPTLKMLREFPHIVEVNTWFEGMEALHKRYRAPSPVISVKLHTRILDSEPDFVWCSTPEAYLEFYDGWRLAGAKVVPLPWACDTERYYPVRDGPFGNVELAFVGGYRAYKEPQYRARLWPYGKHLKVWGYSTWPRCYQGYLPNEDERRLYSQARLCPTLSEPQFAVTGDTVERPFKIMGCGGLTVLDMPCYRELFTDDEALMPANVAQYHDIVRAVLQNPAAYAHYRHTGYEAVLGRHTYAHRARTIMQELGL